MKKQSEPRRYFGGRSYFIKQIAETTAEAKNCKHQWKIHEVKRWWLHSVFLYCPKCGSWKEIL